MRITSLNTGYMSLYTGRKYVKLEGWRCCRFWLKEYLHCSCSVYQECRPCRVDPKNVSLVDIYDTHKALYHVSKEIIGKVAERGDIINDIRSRLYIILEIVQKLANAILPKEEWVIASLSQLKFALFLCFTT